MSVSRISELGSSSGSVRSSFECLLVLICLLLDNGMGCKTKSYQQKKPPASKIQHIPASCVSFRVSWLDRCLGKGGLTGFKSLTWIFWGWAMPNAVATLDARWSLSLKLPREFPT